MLAFLGVQISFQQSENNDGVASKNKTPNSFTYPADYRRYVIAMHHQDSVVFCLSMRLIRFVLIGARHHYKRKRPRSRNHNAPRLFSDRALTSIQRHSSGPSTDESSTNPLVNLIKLQRIVGRLYESPDPNYNN